MIDDGERNRTASNGITANSCGNINGRLDLDRGTSNSIHSNGIDSKICSDEMLDTDSEYSELHPFVEIVEQPAPNAIRFRHECEERATSSVIGKSSTKTEKTYPSIRVVNYSGKAVVVVSCVTKDPPFRAHPHNLTGKDGCKKGVCTLLIPEDTMVVEFRNLAIQCVNRKEVSDSLRVRQEIRVDPYQTGYDDLSMDLSTLRLCFQVFLADDEGRLRVPLKPIVSEPIVDKKSVQNLAIKSFSSCTSIAAGGTRLILLCNQVDRDDIRVRFFEPVAASEEAVVWEDFGSFLAENVHFRTAIEMRTPAYRDLLIDKPVEVRVQLLRPSDGARSEPVPFLFCPLDQTNAKLWSLFRQCEKSLETADEVLNDGEKLVEENEDAMSYTSIQMAFKNPFIDEPGLGDDLSRDYDDVCDDTLPAAASSRWDRSAATSSWLVADRDSPPLPLPPKRYRPQSRDTIDARKRASCMSCYTIALNDREADQLIRTSAGVLRSVSLRSTAALPTPSQPPLPLPPHRKKPGFLRRFFSRAKFDQAQVASAASGSRRFPNASGLASVTPKKPNQVQGKITNQSSRKPLKYYSSNDLVIHIPLRDSDDEDKGDEVPATGNDTELTEAENYALYTDLAPFATQSEFDDMSCLYGSVANRNC